MENSYLYKTRMSLINLDVFLLFVIDVFAWFLNFWAGIIFLFLLFFLIINIISMRMYVYEDRIEYKVGFVLKTYTKSMSLNKISIVSYSSDVFGKLFNYGDIIIGTYNEKDNFNLKGMKNAKMLTENIKELVFKGEK